MERFEGGRQLRVALVRCDEEGIVRLILRVIFRVHEEGEAMSLAGLTQAAYACARRCLCKAIRSLTSELREAAQDLLRSAA